MTKHGAFPGVMGPFPVIAFDNVTGHPVVQFVVPHQTIDAVELMFKAFDLETNAGLSAVAQNVSAECGGGSLNAGVFYQSGVAAGRQLLRRFEPIGATPLDEGWVESAWAQPAPRVGERIPQKYKDYPSGWYPATDGVFGAHLASVSFAAWGGTRADIWKVSDDSDGLPLVAVRPLPESGTLIEVGNLVTSGVWAWSSKTGPAPLLRTFGDTTQGSGAVASDGKDLVWVQGSGKPPGVEAPYATMEVMTAPFSFSSAIVAAGTRRVKGARDAEFTRPFVVGCGYATRKTFSNTAPKFSGVELVRLSDGAAWLLRDDQEGTGGTWLRPLFLTCSELFVRLGKPFPNTGIARVRIDTLGPPTPAD